MAADREVIKEFLIALGFNVQQTSLKKFTEALFSTEKNATKTGLAVLGIATAAEVMVGIFARNMEKLYYASQRTKSSVESLQALRFGAAQVGVEAETAAAALESMSTILRTQPGSRAILDQILGKPTDGMENLQAFYELIRKLREMPHEYGSQYAAMFGIDEKTFFMLKLRLEELIAADEKRRQMNKEAGIDAQAAAAASREYMNTLRELWEQVEIVAQKISIDLLPAFRSIAEGVKEALKFLAKLDYSSMDKLLDSVDKQAEKWGKWASEIRLVTDSLRTWNQFFSAETVGKAGAFVMGGPNWRNGGRPDGGLFPPGSPGYNAAARVLNTEGPLQNVPSEELGRKMVALGMLRRLYDSPGSGEEQGALESAIASHEAAIRSLRSQGYVPSGITAPGALDAMRYGENGGASIVQRTEINVYGNNDPNATGRAVAGEQGRVNSDLVRNTRGAVN